MNVLLEVVSAFKDEKLSKEFLTKEHEPNFFLLNFDLQFDISLLINKLFLPTVNIHRDTKYNGTSVRWTPLRPGT